MSCTNSEPLIRNTASCPILRASLLKSKASEDEAE